MSLQIGFPYSTKCEKEKIQQACIHNYSIINHSTFNISTRLPVTKLKIREPVFNVFSPLPPLPNPSEPGAAS